MENILKEIGVNKSKVGLVFDNVYHLCWMFNGIKTSLKEKGISFTAKEVSKTIVVGGTEIILKSIGTEQERLYLKGLALDKVLDYTNTTKKEIVSEQVKHLTRFSNKNLTVKRIEELQDSPTL